MSKVRIALIAILITSVAFISCERAQKMLDPVVDDMTVADDTMKMMTDMTDSTMYMSWASVALPVPPTEVTNPGESGGVHGMGTRTVYINDTGAMANMDGTMYPAGTVIVKTIMDDANTFVQKKAVMMKSDDPMYAGHNGWMYAKYARSSEDAEYMQVKGSNLEDAAMGCHGCHAKAGTEGDSGHDSVFVSLTMDDMADDKMMKIMTDMMDSTMYMSWAHVALPVPPTEVTNPGESGGVHGMGTRTVYINDTGAMANMDGTMYPAGTVIVKTIMDDANTFVQKKAVMMKSDDPMYAGHNGWMYAKYARSSEDAEYMQVKGSNLEDAAMGCHGCHAKAGTEGDSGHDSVFVSLAMDDMTDEMDNAHGDPADDGNANAGDVQ